MDQHDRIKKPDNLQPDQAAEDLQKTIDQTYTDIDLKSQEQLSSPQVSASPTSPQSTHLRPASVDSREDPLSAIDQKLKESWSESLPQPAPSGTIDVKTEQIKLDQSTTPNKQELRTTVDLSSTENKEEIPVVADTIIESKSGTGTIITPQDTPIGTPANILPTLPLSFKPEVAKKLNFLPVVIVILILSLIAILVFVVVNFIKWPTINFSFINSFQKTKSASTTQPTISQRPTTIAPVKPTQTATVSADLRHRPLSWFIAIPPSIVPSSITTTWPSFQVGQLSFKYPKNWQLIDSQAKIVDTGLLIIAKLFIPPADDLPNQSPIEIIVIKSPADINTLIASIVSDKSSVLTRTQIAVNSFKAIKTTNETNTAGESIQRLFITVDDQVVILTLTPQAQEDQIIFDAIADSIKLI